MGEGVSRQKPHLFRVLDPLDLLPVGGDVLKRLCVVDGKHEEKALPRPHVLVPHGAVLFLAGRVEDVEQAGLPVDDHLLAVGVLDGGVVLVDKVVLDELRRNRREMRQVAQHDRKDFLSRTHLDGQGTFADTSG